MEKSGAQIVVDTLIELGVDTVFGYPGGFVLPIYEALYGVRDKLHHVLTSHEQGAAHAADGYARATGKTGVAIATSGPGATNLVTGIATAHMDSIPTVFITGNVPSSMLGTDAFQEADIVGITMPITKYNWAVRDVRDIAPTLRAAFALANEGRKGPVLVDITRDAQGATCTWEPAVQPAKAAPSLQERVRLFEQEHSGALDRAAQAIAASERPFIIVGGGAVRANAAAPLRAFAEKLHCPVASTLLALGIFPSDHAQFVGNFGMHGNHAANRGSQQADLVIGIATRFNDRLTGDASTFVQGRVLLHIDIDAAEIDKNIPSSLSLQGDAAVALTALTQRIAAKTSDGAWLAKVKAQSTVVETQPRAQGLAPAPLLASMQRMLGEDALVCTDVGQHQMWVAQYYPFMQPGLLITSGGLGTMGFGLGAAIGAQLGQRERRVVLVTGDGSFRMNLTEMSTMVEQGLPIIIVLMNNQVLGMVRQWQTLFYDKHYSSTTLTRGPDFCKLATAYGIEGHRVVDQAEFEAAFAHALASGKPALIECMIHKDEMVRPMVASGHSIDDFVLD